MKKLKGFTMLEILIITIVVGIGLLSIVFAINKIKSRTNQIKQEIIANQLAKEGIELMYQTRNTNLIKNSGIADVCRLNINPNENCDGNNARFSSGNYIIISGNIITGTNEKLLLSGGISTGDKDFALCLIGNKWVSCPGQENHTQYGNFFRVIQGIGLYDKDPNITGGNLLECPTGKTSSCSDNIAKEYRFCSTVFYIGEKKGKAEICSIMTNFLD